MYDTANDVDLQHIWTSHCCPVCLGLLRRYFTFFLICFLTHQTAINLFRLMGAIGRSLVVAYVIAWLLFLLLILLCGLLCPTYEHITFCFAHAYRQSAPPNAHDAGSPSLDLWIWQRIKYPFVTHRAYAAKNLTSLWAAQALCWRGPRYLPGEHPYTLAVTTAVNRRGEEAPCV